MSNKNADLTARVTVLERNDIEKSANIKEINTKIGHIEEQMDDLKTIAKSNTDANRKTNETLTDIHLIIKEGKGFAKGMAFFLTALVSIIGIISYINGS